MLSLVRYTVSRCALTHVWVPPWIAFVLMIAVSYPSGAGALGSLSLGVVFLLGIATWIGAATLNSEPATQGAALAVLQGGVVPHRLALLLSATLASAVLTPLSVGLAAVNDPAELGTTELTVAVLAHLTAAVTGVTVGAVVSRPLVQRAGYALLLATAILVVLVAVPELPPVRLMVDILQTPRWRPQDQAVALVTTIATMTAAGLVWLASAVLARRQA